MTPQPVDVLMFEDPEAALRSAFAFAKTWRVIALQALQLLAQNESDLASERRRRLELLEEFRRIRCQYGEAA